MIRQFCFHSSSRGKNLKSREPGTEQDTVKTKSKHCESRFTGASANSIAIFLAKLQRFPQQECDDAPKSLFRSRIDKYSLHLKYRTIITDSHRVLLTEIYHVRALSTGIGELVMYGLVYLPAMGRRTRSNHRQQKQNSNSELRDDRSPGDSRSPAPVGLSPPQLVWALPNAPLSLAAAIDDSIRREGEMKNIRGGDERD
ncbi:hypothetical protein AVEN_34854-1 [Araneus ventricosus]|uniref:Uncharacterized protein n=1 Tax=Araneus ventricosus TaxID=182803 RepID=A0A4Y2LVY4_ARAVE|nr:hypothetical protein AVEN_34854-1 [Araneus ventricosus]